MRVQIEFHDGSVEIVSGVYRIWLCTQDKTITMWRQSTPDIVSLKEDIKRVSVGKSSVIWEEARQ